MSSPTSLLARVWSRLTVLFRHNRERIVIWMIAFAALLPLIIFSTDFAKLYWFHDDWDMLDGASRLGLWRWLSEPFLGESVIPVSKALGLATVRLSGGSYFGTIALLFAAHSANVALYGHVLRRLRLPAHVFAFALATFALPWTNIETLGWAMQGTALVAMTFFLIAWLWLVGREPRRAWGIAGYILILGGSALASSRGIVSGLLLALFAWITRRRYSVIAAALLPTMTVVMVMRLVVAGRSTPRLLDAVVYALHYWLLNPLLLLLPIPNKSGNPSALLICGAIKLAVLAVTWLRSRDLRPLLATLLCFDLMTAVTLGFARAGGGLETAVSSRYQYVSLFCFGPFAGLLLARARGTLVTAVFIVWLAVIAWPWPRHARRWAQQRGVQVPRSLETTPGDELLWPSHITAARARELIREYNLH